MSHACSLSLALFWICCKHLNHSQTKEETTHATTQRWNISLSHSSGLRSHFGLSHPVIFWTWHWNRCTRCSELIQSITWVCYSAGGGRQRIFMVEGVSQALADCTALLLFLSSLQHGSCKHEYFHPSKFPCLESLIGAQQLLAWCSLHFSGVTYLLRLLEVYGQIKLVASVYWDWE